jgi:uncharacterized protein DUF1259
LFLENGTLDCNMIASDLGGTPLHKGSTCDVTIVRQSPVIKASDNIESNKLMNNVIEFSVLPSISTDSIHHQVLAVGNFTLLDTELEGVHSITQFNGWNVTETHNPSGTPSTTLMHWRNQGDINNLVGSANVVLIKTTIKGLSNIE